MMYGSVLLAAMTMLPLASAQLPDPPTSLFDPRLDSLKRASIVWANRLGPKRIVVDQVVVAADMAGYLDAVAGWDRQHWYPVLIEDAELVPKFLRAFQPRKVLRIPASKTPLAASQTWEKSSLTVERSWRKPDTVANSISAVERAGETVPKDLGPTPPGVVLSHPESASLAGAVALAAGHMQPLVSWKTTLHRKDDITTVQAGELTIALQEVISKVAPQYASLGDDCDFLTLAGDYPYRYQLTGKVFREGTASFDDRVGRDSTTGRRWAYVGRLEGDPAASVYRAMASLFLQPTSALLVETYDANVPDFKPYAMSLAEANAPPGLKATTLAGMQGTLSGLLESYRGRNPFDLVYINSQGSPVMFGLNAGDQGLSLDVPHSSPCVVIMNHSYSAANPEDPATLAGSWLDEGAFLYFGSLNEPYIQSFRTPQLVLSLHRDKLPFAAAVRMIPEEHPVFGTPWRLHILGDPLYRIDPLLASQPRQVAGNTPPGSVLLTEKPAPGARATAASVLAWVENATMRDAAANRPRDATAKLLVAMRRDKLPPDLRETFDGLLIDLLGRGGAQRDRALKTLRDIPPSNRSPRVQATLLREQVQMMQSFIAQKNWKEAWSAWRTLMAEKIDDATKRNLTARVTRWSLRGGVGPAWKVQLETALRSRATESDSAIYRDEIAEIVRRLGKS